MDASSIKKGRGSVFALPIWLWSDALSVRVCTLARVLVSRSIPDAVVLLGTGFRIGDSVWIQEPEGVWRNEDGLNVLSKLWPGS